jgi:hypothetical protein
MLQDGDQKKHPNIKITIIPSVEQKPLCMPLKMLRMEADCLL